MNDAETLGLSRANGSQKEENPYGSISGSLNSAEHAFPFFPLCPRSYNGPTPYHGALVASMNFVSYPKRAFVSHLLVLEGISCVLGFEK